MTRTHQLPARAQCLNQLRHCVPLPYHLLYLIFVTVFTKVTFPYSQTDQYSIPFTYISIWSSYSSLDLPFNFAVSCVLHTPPISALISSQFLRLTPRYDAVLSSNVFLSNTFFLRFIARKLVRIHIGTKNLQNCSRNQFDVVVPRRASVEVSTAVGGLWVEQWKANTKEKHCGRGVGN
jgi:hypothetical protein